jgi:hypothetical protein
VPKPEGAFVVLESDSPLSRFWRSYNQALEEKPVLVKSATSFFGFLIGDIIAQNIVGLPFDYWRTFRLVAFGIFMDGPVGARSCYLNYLHLVLPQPYSTSFKWGL